MSGMTRTVVGEAEAKADLLARIERLEAEVRELREHLNLRPVDAIARTAELRPTDRDRVYEFTIAEGCVLDIEPMSGVVQVPTVFGHGPIFQCEMGDRPDLVAAHDAAEALQDAMIRQHEADLKHAASGDDSIHGSFAGAVGPV